MLGAGWQNRLPVGLVGVTLSQAMLLPSIGPPASATSHAKWPCLPPAIDSLLVVCNALSSRNFAGQQTFVHCSPAAVPNAAASACQLSQGLPSAATAMQSVVSQLC